MGDQPVIVTEGLSKRFGPVRALDGIDLEQPAGTVLGMLGPNGAGKTTMVRILATLLSPDGGRARVAGLDVAEQGAAVRRLIGLSGQYAAVDPHLTGRENLQMIGRLYGLGRHAARPARLVPGRAYRPARRRGGRLAHRAAGCYCARRHRPIPACHQHLTTPGRPQAHQPHSASRPAARTGKTPLLHLQARAHIVGS